MLLIVCMFRGVEVLRQTLILTAENSGKQMFRRMLYCKFSKREYYTVQTIRLETSCVVSSISVNVRMNLSSPAI